MSRKKPKADGSIDTRIPLFYSASTENSVSDSLYPFRFLKNPIVGTGDHWNFFPKAGTPIVHSPVERPKPQIGGPMQTDKTSVKTEMRFQSGPVSNIKATLPFHGMRQDVVTSG